MTNGLILVGFLALLFAILMARSRRHLGMSVSGRTFAVAACAFAIAVLILWATAA